MLALMITLGIVVVLFCGGAFLLLPMLLVAPLVLVAALAVGAVVFALWIAFALLRVALWMVLAVGGVVLGLVALPLVLIGGLGVLVVSLAPVWLPLLAIALVVWAANRSRRSSAPVAAAQ